MPVLKQSEHTFIPAPAGLHVARCVAMISLGTQPPSNPKYTPSFKVLLTFELPNEPIEVNGKPSAMTVNRFLNAYLGSANKPSQTAQFLTSWRGRPFTAEELAGFDLAKVVGAPCMLNVIHEVKGDKTNANIASISPLAKGMTCPPMVNTPIVYEIEQKETGSWSLLPEWVQKMIKQSAEWQHPVGPVEDVQDPGPDPDAEDNVPF